MMRAAVIALCLVLTGCSVTLYSREWDARGAPFDECEHDRHNPVTGCYPSDDEPGARHNAAGGYVAACGELPGMLGDDC